MSGYFAFIDFGSTYTKICVIDPKETRFVAHGQAPTTVNTDITIGLSEAISRLKPPVTLKECDVVRATSSAAGGLRMVASGLIPDLTAEAANRAALGAGAKVLKVFSHRLTDREVREIETIKPDAVLLSGGTDGGNKEVIVYNANRLAKSEINRPVVVAGNKEADDEIQDILTASGQRAYIADNVMPEIGKLAVDSAREKIREVFLEHIVKAKGLEKAKTLVDEIIMPTPMAILKAANVLAKGTLQQKGMGEVIVVDVGGATTDIHSAATGNPTDPYVILKGLPEPFAKRTVEGDLGIRINAMSILHLARSQPGTNDLFTKYDERWGESRCNHLSTHINILSQKQQEKEFDLDLARAAVTIAINRHVARIETLYSLSGATQVQIGKDLTVVHQVIGTGGIFAHGSNPGYVLQGTKRRESDKLLLKPEKPEFWIDKQYILFAAGLLSDINRDAAFAIMKRYLKKVGKN